jgi:hypothetical protein
MKCCRGQEFRIPAGGNQRTAMRLILAQVIQPFSRRYARAVRQKVLPRFPPLLRSAFHLLFSVPMTGAVRGWFPAVFRADPGASIAERERSSFSGGRILSAA